MLLIFSGQVRPHGQAENFICKSARDRQFFALECHVGISLWRSGGIG